MFKNISNKQIQLDHDYKFTVISHNQIGTRVFS